MGCDTLTGKVDRVAAKAAFNARFYVYQVGTMFQWPWYQAQNPMFHWSKTVCGMGAGARLLSHQVGSQQMTLTSQPAQPNVATRSDHNFQAAGRSSFSTWQIKGLLHLIHLIRQDIVQHLHKGDRQVVNNLIVVGPDLSAHLQLINLEYKLFSSVKVCSFNIYISTPFALSLNTPSEWNLPHLHIATWCHKHSHKSIQLSTTVKTSMNIYRNQLSPGIMHPYQGLVHSEVESQ